MQHHKSSWIDDPFELKFSVTGVTNMSHEKRLSAYAEELVSTYASYSDYEYTLSIDTVPEDEQAEFARLYIEVYGRETTECVHGGDLSKESNYTCALLNMLKNDCKETRELFAEVTKKNIINYYKECMDELLVESCLNKTHAVNNENNMYSYIDMEHGDVVWSRF